MSHRPELEIVAPGATMEEAAAVVAALEQFMRDHAPVRVERKPPLSPWKVAALAEGVSRAPDPLPPWA